MSQLGHPAGSSLSGSLEAGQPVLLSTSTRMPWRKTATAPSPRAAGDMTPEAATAFEMLMEISVDIDQSEEVVKTRAVTSVQPGRCWRECAKRTRHGDT